ncbi:MAG: N-acetyltransferase family protein [Acidimicrobiales bacterium]|jgi:GNAT superfamily N-acetyltransferase
MTSTPVPDRSTASPITVRAATVADAGAITEAQTAAWQSAYRGIMPDRYLDGLSKDKAGAAQHHRVHIASPNDPRNFSLVAEYEGAVIGWLAAGPSRDDDRHDTEGEVQAIYVHPDYWRSGAGGALMTAALERLTAGGFTEAVLWVFEENRRARRFYGRFGWRPDGATDIFERGGGQAIEIRYRRPLT